MDEIFLLVDDDRDDFDLFSEALQEIEESAVCHCATNGKEALEVLKKIKKPDIIFLDINMPIMSGWECLKKLKEDPLYNDIPVIMYSTSSHQREIDIAKEMGALNFISKPHDYKKLIQMLQEVITEMRNGYATYRKV